MRYTNIIYAIITLFVATTSCKKITPVAIYQINGASNVCLGEKLVQYTVSAESPVDYILWAVPEGAEIISGQGTNSITVNFGGKPGKIHVYLYNDGELVNSEEAYLEVSFGVSNQWCRDINLPSVTRANAVGFSIGNKGYVGVGNAPINGTLTNCTDFWEYDPATLMWTQKAPFPGIPRVAAVGFSIGSKGYIGTGYRVSGAIENDYLRDFWEYDPVSNAWTEKDSLPGQPRQYAVGFSIGNRGYIGAGQIYHLLPQPTSISLADFYEFNPEVNQWTQKSSLPDSMIAAAAFSIGNKGYVGTGSNGGFNYYNYFYEYDPVNDQWIQKNPFPGPPRAFAVGFAIDNKGYIGAGKDNTFYYGDFYEYDPVNGLWIEKDSFPGQPRGYAVGFSIGNNGYIGIGSASPSVFLDDFWVFKQ